MKATDLLSFDSKAALLRGVPFRPSPNCDQRPVGSFIDLIVIHNISLPPRQFGEGFIDALFLNCLDYTKHAFFETLINLRVSPHLLIHRTGEVIQYVPFDRRAWHAGVSKFQGRENCNDFSIGIELEGADDIPYTAMQYQQLACITKILLQVYKKITKNRIVGHSDIAPERKTDPGPAFNWKYFLSLLN